MWLKLQLLMKIQKLLMTLYYLKSLQYLALNLNLSKYIKDDCVLARKIQLLLLGSWWIMWMMQQDRECTNGQYFMEGCLGMTAVLQNVHITVLKILGKYKGSPNIKIVLKLYSGPKQIYLTSFLNSCDSQSVSHKCRNQNRKSKRRK